MDKKIPHDFYQFQRQIVKNKHTNPAYFVGRINYYETKYKQAGQDINFAHIIFKFAEKMQKLNIQDLPGIIFSYLAKMQFLNPEIRELYITTGLKYAQKQGDLIHILARLADLKYLYKGMNLRHKYANILFQQENVLTKICTNFNEVQNNYKTYSREHNTLKHYEMELAKTRVDIAKIILRSNPKQAKKMLQNAKIIFEREGRQKEVSFVNLMLSEIA